MQSIKTKTKVSDGTRNLQNCRCDAYSKQHFEGLEKRTNSEPNDQENDKSINNHKQGSRESRLGVKQVICLIESARSRFATIVLPTTAGSTVLKHVI